MIRSTICVWLFEAIHRIEASIDMYDCHDHWCVLKPHWNWTFTVHVGDDVYEVRMNACDSINSMLCLYIYGTGGITYLSDYWTTHVIFQSFTSILTNTIIESIFRRWHLFICAQIDFFLSLSLVSWICGFVFYFIIIYSLKFL